MHAPPHLRHALLLGEHSLLTQPVEQGERRRPVPDDGGAVDGEFDVGGVVNAARPCLVDLTVVAEARHASRPTRRGFVVADCEQCPPHEGRHHGQSVVGGSSHVVEWGQTGDRSGCACVDRLVIKWLADEGGSSVGEHLDAGSDAADRQPSVTNDTVGCSVDGDAEVNDGDGLGGSVAELHPNPCLRVAEGGKFDGGDEFVVSQHRGSESSEKVVEAKGSLAAD